MCELTFIVFLFSRRSASLTSSYGCCLETNALPTIAVQRISFCGRLIRSIAGNTADCWNPINSSYALTPLSFVFDCRSSCSCLSCNFHTLGAVRVNIFDFIRCRSIQQQIRIHEKERETEIITKKHKYIKNNILITREIQTLDAMRRSQKASSIIHC